MKRKSFKKEFILQVQSGNRGIKIEALQYKNEIYNPQKCFSTPDGDGVEFRDMLSRLKKDNEILFIVRSKGSKDIKEG